MRTMSKFYDALTDFMNKLQGLSKNTLNLNTNGLEDKTFSQQLFVDRKIISKELRDEIFKQRPFASFVDSKTYGANSIQSLWNCANYVSTNVLVSKWNENVIVQSLSYMDAAWVPKIINETTFKVGQALLEFITKVINERLLDELYITKEMRHEAYAQLNSANLTLNSRLVVYEAHSEDHIAYTKHWLAFKRERVAALSNFISQFNQNIIEMDQYLTVNQKSIDEMVTTNTEALIAQVQELDKKVLEFKSVIALAKTNNDHWQHNNLSGNPPEQVPSSQLLVALADPSCPQQDLVTYWLELYNSDRSRVYSEPVGSFFVDNHTINLRLIEESENNILRLIESQRMQLANKIAESKLLIAFITDLDEYIAFDPDPEVPSCVAALDTDTLPLAEELPQYKELMNQLYQYKLELIEHKQVLTKNLNTIAKNHADNANKPAFREAIDKAALKLQQRIDLNTLAVNTIDSMLNNYKFKLSLAEDKIIAASATARASKLEQLDSAIQAQTRTLDSESLPAKVTSDAELVQFNNTLYLPALEHIYHKYNATIDELKTRLNTLTREDSVKQQQLDTEQTAIDIRREFLINARAKLVELQEALENYKGIYMPEDILTQDQLLEYLECTQAEQLAAINSLYQLKRDASGIWGLKKKASDKMAYLTTIPIIQTYKYQWELIKPHLANKIACIDQELTLNSNQNMILIPQPTEYIKSTNLWTMIATHAVLSSEKHVLDRQKSLVREQLKKMATDKEGELLAWNPLKLEKEQAAAVNNLNYHSQALAIELTKQTHAAYEYEFCLNDIEQKLEEIKNCAEKLDILSYETGLELYTSQQEWMQQSDAYMNTAGVDLQNKVQQILDTNAQALRQLHKLQKDVNKVPPASAELLSQLTFRFDESRKKIHVLNETFKRVKTSHQQLMQQIASRKTALDSQQMDVFSQRMNNLVLNPADIPVPNCISILEQRSLGAILEFEKDYEVSIEEAGEYQVELSQLTEILRNNKQLIVAELNGKPEFREMATKAILEINQRISTTEETNILVDALLVTFRVALQKAKEKNEAFDINGKKNLVQKANLRIKSLSHLIENEAQPAKQKADSELREFLKEQYDPAVQVINAQFKKPMDELAQELAAINNLISAKSKDIAASDLMLTSRRANLNTAKVKLLEYQKILTNHTGIYIPEKEIPKSLLCLYLECFEKEKLDAINSLYKLNQEANAWFGFNKVNTSNHYAYFSETNLKHHWDFVKEFIDQKIACIDNELQFDTTDNSIPAPTSFIPSINLWTLKPEHVALGNEKAQLEQRKVPVNQQLLALETQRQEQLSKVFPEKFEKEHEVAEKNLHYQMSQFDLDLTLIIKYSYELDIKLLAIDKAQQELEEVAKIFEHYEVDEGLAYYKSVEEKVLHCSVAWIMDHKDLSEHTGNQLQTKIQNKLQTMQIALSEFRNLVHKVGDVPRATKIKLIELAVHFNDLRQKSTELTQNLEQLKQINVVINDRIQRKKNNLEAIKKISDTIEDIDTKFPEIMEGKSVLAINRELRLLLIAKIQSFVTPIKAFMTAYERTGSEKTAGYAILQAKMKKLSVEFNKLKSTQMEEDYQGLLNRFPVKTKGERAVLLADVEKHVKADAQYIKELEHDENSYIKSQIAKVKQLQFKIEPLLVRLKDEELPDETEQEKFDREFKIRMNILSVRYFGAGSDKLESKVLGIFDSYLKQRAESFWFYDLFRAAATFAFQCIGYKSDTQLRQEFINENLTKAFNKYQTASPEAKEDAFDDLIEIIEQGQTDFRPRAKNGEVGYKFSLCYKLELLTKDLNDYKLDYEHAYERLLSTGEAENERSKSLAV